MEFFLDVNEPGTTNQNKSFITLDQLEIYVSHRQSDLLRQDHEQRCHGRVDRCDEDCDMDTASKDQCVQLDYNLSSQGSGSSDMVFYLPNSLFGNNQHVYLYSQFGKIDNNNNKHSRMPGSRNGSSSPRPTRAS